MARPRGAEPSLLAGGAVALSLVALAHSSEVIWGLQPCELCLMQRDVYWATAAAALVLTGVVRLRPQLGALALLALGLFFFTEAALAAYHAGVEWRWWPGPSRCTGAGARALTTADMQSLLSGKPQKIVQCDVAAIRVLGLSMAGWNTLVALALGATSLLAARSRSYAL